jgi:hypothetical protein
MKIRKVVSLFIILKFKEVEIMIILEEILWIKKYIMVDFSLKNFWFTEMMGIIEKKVNFYSYSYTDKGSRR